MYDNTDDYDFGTDLSGVDENQFDTIPPGKYPMQCIGIELADTQSGGKMVKAKFQVISGQYENRIVFENFNVQNSNPSTVNIALGQIKQWLAAVGQEPNQRLTLNLLRSLEGQEFLGSVRIQKDKSGQYGDQNRIGKYEALGNPAQAQSRPAQASPAPRQSAPPRQAQPQASATGGKLPWQA